MTVAAPARTLRPIAPDTYPPGVEWFQLTAPTSRGDVTRRVVVVNPAGHATVVLMHEAPGLSGTTMRVATCLASAGFRVVMPILLEAPRESFGFVAATLGLVRICWHREFAALSGRTTSAIVDWLRCLADVEHGSSKRPVGIIGMCFSGGFALGTIVHRDDANAVVNPDVAAAVVSQPALPFPYWITLLGDLGLSQADLDALRTLPGGGACVRGLRFAADIKSPVARMRRLHEVLPGAEICEIPTRDPRKHSVLAKGADASEGTRLATSFDDTIKFLQRWLMPPDGAPPPS